MNEIRGKRVSAFKSDLISFAYIWLKYVRRSGNIACPGDSVPHARFFRVRPSEIIASHFIPDKEQHAPPVRVPIHSISFYGSFVHDEGSSRSRSAVDQILWRGRLTDRSIVGVQVLGGHKLRHQGALANGGGAQHEDAIRGRTLGRTALPRTRQRTCCRIPRRSRIRGRQVLRAAPNRRKARRVSRLAWDMAVPSIYILYRVFLNEREKL